MTRSEAWMALIQAMRIRTRDRRVVPLRYNVPQQMIWTRAAPLVDAGRPIRFIVLKARREGVCLDPATRILMEDLSWKPISEVLLGDRIVAVDEHIPGGKGHHRRLRVAVVQGRHEVRQPAFRLTMDDGRVLIATGPHRFLSRTRGGVETAWRRVEQMRPGDVIRTVTEPWSGRDYEDGWFGGLVDGEATLRPKTRAGCELTITQLPGLVYDRAVKYLKDRQYHVRQSLDDYPRSHRDGYHRQPIGRIMVGRMNELIRLIGQTSPSRLPTEWWQNKELPGKRSGVAWVRVVSIEPLGLRGMVDLQTSTATFIAEGFVSHNSTEIESWLMAFISSSDLVNALVMAHIAKATRRIWNMSKLFVSSSPNLSSLGTIGQHSIHFGKSTLDIATAGSPEAERASDLTAIHLSEVAFFQRPEALVAVMQTLPPPHVFSIGVIESTANGKVGAGALFYDEWTSAVAGESEWTPIFLSCLDFPENQLPGLVIEEPDAEERVWREQFGATDAQIAWRRWAIANLCQRSVDRFHQEHPVSAEEAFVTSGLPFFRSEHLLPMQVHIRNGKKGDVDPEGRFTPSPTGWLEVFVPPQPGHQYVVGSDSSMGIPDEMGTARGHSRSAAEVLDMETMEQVAEYDAATAPHIQARHLAGIGRYYNHALLAPEVQSSGGGGGREIIVYLRDMEYWNIHRWKQPDRVERQAGHVYGWETNTRTRPRMLARIREVVMERSAIIHSRRLLSQLGDFGENDQGRMEALAGRDDLLFAYGIALMSRSENYYRAPTGAQYEPVIQK